MFYEILKRHWQAGIFLSSIIISIGFISLVDFVLTTNYSKNLQLLSLFFSSLVFSSILFHIIFKQQSELRKNEQSRIQNLVTTSIIKAQEEERKRLSRELHDGIGQSIFSVLLGIEFLDTQINDDTTKAHIENLRKTTKQTLEEIRHMAVELRPSVLDDLGLIAALKSYIKTFGETFGIQINFEYIGDKGRLPANVETAFYRISQEALINVAKYADSERVDISMRKRQNQFTLTVTDYGQGFSVNEVRANEQGVGLYSMEERAAMLKGSFNVISEKGKGTSVVVSIPIQRKEG